MAASLASNMKVYDNYAAGRTNELLAQFGDVFNAASNGAISLTTKTVSAATTPTSRSSRTSALPCNPP
jgi:hypothetical protein